MRHVLAASSIALCIGAFVTTPSLAQSPAPDSGTSNRLRVLAALVGPVGMGVGLAVNGARGGVTGGLVGGGLALLMDVALPSVRRHRDAQLCVVPGASPASSIVVPGTPAIPQIGDSPGIPATPDVVISGVPRQFELCQTSRPGH